MAERLEIIISAKDRFSKSFSKLRSAMPSLRTVALGATAAVAGLGAAITAIVKTTANAYDEVQKFSDQIGVSTEFISKMNHAADLAAVRQETIRKAMQQAQVTAVEAARGIKTYKDAYDELGISVNDAQGNFKGAEQLILEMADAFNNMESATLKTNVASKIFGLRGVTMLQLFKDGRAGLKEMTDEAERFGLVVSAEAGASAAAFNDSLTRLTGSVTGIKNAFAEELFPELTRSNEKLAEWVAKNRELIVLKTTEWLRNVAIMAKAVGDSLLWIDKNITDRVLKFFFGETDLSKMQILQKGLEQMRGSLKKYEAQLISASRAGFVDEEYIKRLQQQIRLIEDSIEIRKEEIAQLTQKKELEGIAGGGPEVPALVGLPPPGAGAAGAAGAALKILEQDIAGLKALWSEYYQSEAGRVEQWYSDQLEKYKGNKQALILVDEVYDAKKQELRDNEAELEANKLSQLQELYNQHFLSRGEQLDLWYEQEQLKFVGNQDALLQLQQIYQEKKKSLEVKSKDATGKILGQTLALAQAFGKKGFKIAQALSIAQATMYAYESFNKTMAAYAYPFNVILAGLSLATSLAQVATIAAQKPPAAHSGLTNVPAEGPFLLDRNERVLSPTQNKDLTDFLKQAAEGGGALKIENLTFEILPNATNIDALMSMDKNEIRDLLEEKFVEPLKDLQLAGVII